MDSIPRIRRRRKNNDGPLESLWGTVVELVVLQAQLRTGDQVVLAGAVHLHEVDGEARDAHHQVLVGGGVLLGGPHGVGGDDVDLHLHAQHVEEIGLQQVGHLFDAVGPVHAAGAELHVQQGAVGELAVVDVAHAQEHAGGAVLVQWLSCSASLSWRVTLLFDSFPTWGIHIKKKRKQFVLPLFSRNLFDLQSCTTIGFIKIIELNKRNFRNITFIAFINQYGICIPENG